MHILVIPSELYLPIKLPMAGIFQQHHVELLHEYGYQVGVISAGLIPFTYNFRSFPYLHIEITKAATIYRKYHRVFIPGRFAFKYLDEFILGEYIRLFNKYLKSVGRPDIIHAHNSIYAGVVAKRLKKTHNIPYVITEHSSLYQRGHYSAKQLRKTREVFKNADAKTTVSSSLATILRDKIGVDVEPLIPIYNILEDNFKITSTNSAVSDKTKFLSVGSLDTNKNHQFLIKSFYRAFRGNEKYELLIGGEGVERKNLERLIKKLNINNQVKLLGRLERDQVINLMTQADVFVHSSNVETFGVVLIEALGVGTPVISTRSGGPEDIVNEDNGILVSPKDEDQFSDALIYMATNLDNYDAKIISKNCEDKFGRDSYHNRINTLYKKILKEK